MRITQYAAKTWPMASQTLPLNVKFHSAIRRLALSSSSSSLIDEASIDKEVSSRFRDLSSVTDRNTKRGWVRIRGDMRICVSVRQQMKWHHCPRRVLTSVLCAATNRPVEASEEAALARRRIGGCMDAINFALCPVEIFTCFLKAGFCAPYVRRRRISPELCAGGAPE